MYFGEKHISVFEKNIEEVHSKTIVCYFTRHGFKVDFLLSQKPLAASWQVLAEQFSVIALA